MNPSEPTKPDPGREDPPKLNAKPRLRLGILKVAISGCFILECCVPETVEFEMTVSSLSLAPPLEPEETFPGSVTEDFICHIRRFFIENPDDAPATRIPHHGSRLGTKSSRPPACSLPVDPAVHTVLFENYIFAVVDYPGWWECHLCSRAGLRKRFELGDTLWTHLRGGQHQRELLRRRQSDEFRLPNEIKKISDNDFMCTACHCGTISGFESAKAHVRGVKHVKAMIKFRNLTAPTVQMDGSADLI
ncbi:hypothetical protein C9890_0046 [Perkinsus sp. BL_2016]|nr:hypothetical protein C9890_0046 [Perkinsus sp. BL_2016]